MLEGSSMYLILTALAVLAAVLLIKTTIHIFTRIAFLVVLAVAAAWYLR